MTKNDNPKSIDEVPNRANCKTTENGNRAKCEGSIDITAENTVPKTGTLIPQTHGGALRYGGTHKGGPGRTPDELRGTIRQIIDEHGLPFLRAALSATRTMPCPHCEGPIEVPADPKLMAKLLDTGLRVGVGTQQQVEVTGGVNLTHDTT